MDDVAFGLHIDDEKIDDYWKVRFVCSGDSFRYDEWSLRCTIDDLHGNIIPVSIMIKASGVVAYDMDVDDDPEGYHGHLINELNFLLKRLLHDDVYHESDPIHDLSGDASNKEACGRYNDHPDYHITPVVAADEMDAVVKIDRIFTLSLDRFIKKWRSLKDDGVASAMELRLAKGYEVFGEAFCNCTGDIREPQKMLTFLELYKATIEEFRDDAERKESKKSSDAVNKSIIRLTIYTSLLTLVSIFVAYFAGSSLANSLPEGLTTIAVTVITGLITFILLSAITVRYDILGILRNEERD